MYRDTKLTALRSALVDFVRFRAWGTTLAMTSGGLHRLSYGHDHSERDLARAKYAEMPELLAAVEANDARWRRRVFDDGD